MWLLAWQGQEVLGDDLTLAEVEQIERLAETSWYRVMPWNSAVQARACATVAGRHVGLSDVSQVRLSDFRRAKDDIAKVWRDGLPERSGRASDVWIAQLCRPPFSFTPRQVREDFTVRDIKLVLEANRSTAR